MSVAPSDPPLRSLQHSYGPAGYTDEGSGPPIVLVHGLPGSHRDWRYLAACLDTHRVIRLDMPGFGASKACGIGASYERRARFVLETLDALGLEAPIVLGHSMGGPVVAMASNLAPGRIRGIGLLGAPGLRRHRGAPAASAKVVAWLSTFSLSAWAMHRPLVRGFARAGFPRSLTHSERVAALTQVSQYEPALVAQSYRALKVPTLVGFAADDRLVEPEISVELSEACPPGPRLHFESGGHNIQKTQCEAIAEALKGWTPDA